MIRVSGPEAGRCIERLTGAMPEPRKARLRRINDHSGGVIDHGIVIWFPAPNSFTGEDVAEFQVHGGVAVVEKLLAELGEIAHCRLAEAGEFSQRAFLNGKMDLTELEGLADIINAETEFQRQQAVQLMQGWNGQIYEKLRERVIALMGYVEASIDFADEELELDVSAELKRAVEEIREEITKLTRNAIAHETLRDGFRVVLAGDVNVGKSSLLNRLAERDAAIVSNEPGTTRDIIEVRMDIKGYPVLVQDTAGLRETENSIERIGIERSQNAMEKADLILFLHDHEVLDGNEELTFPDKTILVRNKLDLGTEMALKKGEMGISVLKDTGIDTLIDRIGSEAKARFLNNQSGAVLRQRHREHLDNCLKALERISVQDQEGVELIAEDIRVAAASVGAITGRIDVEDMLDKVFSEFCIGK